MSHSCGATMRLRDFQNRLGHALRDPADAAGEPAPERDIPIAALLDSPGFAFTRTIRRSWCEGRAAAMARATLGTLPASRVRELLREWIDRGGGRDSFAPDEALRFLDYLAEHLVDDPQVAELCRIERAIRLATNGMPTFRPPTRLAPGTLVGRGAWATLLTLVDSEPVMFFAPGLPRLCRDADTAEQELWAALIAPMTLTVASRYAPGITVADMLDAGIIEAIGPDC